MPNNKYTRTIIIEAMGGHWDTTLLRGSTQLQQKTGATHDDVFQIDELPKFDPEYVKGARIYLHGHASGVERTLGGYAAPALAKKLADAGVEGAALISITGCNAGRGKVPNAAFAAARDAMREKLNGVLMKRIMGDAEAQKTQTLDGYDGITEHNYTTQLPQHPASVDTTRSAFENADGSLAQVFHRELVGEGVDVDVHARLYSVNTGVDGDGNVHKYVYNEVHVADDGAISPVWNTGVAHAKVKIASAEPGEKLPNNQRITYADDPAEPAADAPTDGDT